VASVVCVAVSFPIHLFVPSVITWVRELKRKTNRREPVELEVLTEPVVKSSVFWKRTFRKKLSPPSSGLKIKPSKKVA
jgi:hypothetical protein